jgi:phage baseplate assembly protein W
VFFKLGCNIESKLNSPMNSKYQKEIANDVVHHLEYNAERSHLIIPEYGRHLQKLIEQAIIAMLKSVIKQQSIFKLWVV